MIPEKVNAAQPRHIENAINLVNEAIIEFTLAEQNEWLMEIRNRIMSHRQINIDDHRAAIEQLEIAIKQIS